MHELVNRAISDDEFCIRCILSPLFCHSTKEKLKENAFLPPPNSDEVSLLRLMYTDLDRCKAHAKRIEEKMKDRINDISYRGLASITQRDVKETNVKSEITCNIVYAPMDEKGNYVKNEKDVYSDDLGLPMHANLIYPFKVGKGEVATKARKYARCLLKLSNFK